MTDFERLSDSDLIEGIRNGDRDAFAEFYDRFAARLFTAFLAAGLERGDAVESTHDSLVDAARRLQGPEAPGDLASWLAEIALPGELDVLPRTDLIPAPPALRPRVLTKLDQMAPEASALPTPWWATVPEEWKKMSLFGFVAVAVGLLGFAVSSQFEPLTPPPTTAEAGPATESTVPVATTSTTIGISTTTTTTPTDPTSTTVAATPGVLEVSAAAIDFGETGTTGELVITNTGGQATGWTLSSSSDAIVVSLGSGELEGGETLTVDLALDRGQIEEGDLAETLLLSWAGGEVEVGVVGSHEDNPVIHNPQASPATVGVEGCPDTQTRVSARIRDTSPLASAVVRWSPDGSSQQETAMEAVGNDMFEAVVGPFTTTGAKEARIVAFDERGNAGGASAAITVTDCE